MNIANILDFVNDRLLQDVSWFLVLCAIFAFLRFHGRRNYREAARGGESSAASTQQTGISEARKKAA